MCLGSVVDAQLTAAAPPDGVKTCPAQPGVFTPPDGRETTFTITHFGTPVSYPVAELLATNGSSLAESLSALISRSSKSMVAGLLRSHGDDATAGMFASQRRTPKKKSSRKKGIRGPSTRGRRKASKHPDTEHGRVKQCLAALLMQLKDAVTDVVRCVTVSPPGETGWDDSHVNKAFGTVATQASINIGAATFPLRFTFETFVAKFGQPGMPAGAKTCEKLLAKLPRSDYAVGTSCVFMHWDGEVVSAPRVCLRLPVGTGGLQVTRGAVGGRCGRTFAKWRAACGVFVLPLTFAAHLQRLRPCALERATRSRQHPFSTSSRPMRRCRSTAPAVKACCSTPATTHRRAPPPPKGESMHRFPAAPCHRSRRRLPRAVDGPPQPP